MLRLILLTMFLGIGFSCFSEEFQQTEKEEWYGESLPYLEGGNANLMAHEPLLALDNFQRATAFLDRSDKASCILGFLISFGQAIAYDTLGYREQCKQSLGSLLLAINEYDEGGDQNLDVKTNEGNSPFNEYEDAVEFLRTLASMAPSSDVREFLFSLVDEMEEELLPDFKFADQPFLGITAWDFDYRQDASIQQCKSLWKKCKRFFKEASEVLCYIAKGYKSAKEIKDTYDDWKNKNNHR